MMVVMMVMMVVMMVAVMVMTKSENQHTCTCTLYIMYISVMAGQLKPGPYVRTLYL